MFGLGRSSATALATAFAVALTLAASASAASLCPEGTGAGQCKQPQGLAVDESSGRTYVADKGNDRIDVFDEAGAFLFSFGEGVLSAPTSVAVDNDPLSLSFHDVYVADFGHRRIVRFDEEGQLPLAIGEGEYEDSSGPERTEAMLVGTSSGSEQLYVVDVRRTPFNAGGECVLGEGGGTAGQCLTTRLRRYAPGGGPPAFERDIATVKRSGAVGGKLRGLAVDSAGDSYIRNGAEGESLCKYDSEGVKVAGYGEAGCFPAAEAEGVTALALDAEDDLFAWGLDRDADGVVSRVIAEYSPGGAPLYRFGYGGLSGLAAGLAIRPDSPVQPGTPLYAPVGEEVRIVPFPQPGPIATGPATEGITSSKALLRADVNPEGKATEYVFQYVPASLCEEDEAELGPGHCFDHARSGEPQTLALEGATPAEEEEHRFRLNRAEEEIGCPDPVAEAGLPESPCLVPETEYRWRIVAENEDSEGPGEGTLEGEPFETTASLELDGYWPTAAGTDSAVLHAAVNPLGVPATGFFEYVTEAAWLEDLNRGGDGFAGASRVPASGSIDFGAGEASVTRSAVASLHPGTAYRFRAVATDPLLEGAGEEVVGEAARRVVTFAPAAPAACAEEGTRGGLLGARSGAAAFLPDCRAYELVSPVEKNNADVVYPYISSNLPARLEESAADGGRFAYNARNAFAEPESAPWSSQYIAARHAGEEWESHAISSPRKRALVLVLKQGDAEFGAFSPDLCEGWLRSFAEPPLSARGDRGQPQPLRAPRRGMRRILHTKR